MVHVNVDEQKKRIPKLHQITTAGMTIKYKLLLMVIT